MQTILIPHTADTSSARIWVGVTGANVKPGDITVTLGNGMQTTAASANWKLVTGGGNLSIEDSRTFTQVVEFSNLPAGTRFIVKANEADARFSTLPQNLPRVGETPFNVLLGSCYFGDHDLGLSNLMHGLLNEIRPDIKFLCGDQVYLDFPSFFLGVPFDAKGKARLFLAKHLRNWSSLNSYRSLLTEGATFFSSDDHEFWNNFPNAATIISSTWTSQGRAQYANVARAFFRDFQTDTVNGPQICRKLNVGSLSFMVADTRFDREEGSGRFMTDGDLDQIVQWAGGLSGPGVLVVGQPIFAEPQNGVLGGIKKTVGDRNLPDYDQYKTLVAALLGAQHSILVLTGDVHYPRVAQAVRPGQAGREITEVIASPAALVFGNHSKTKDAPGSFPAKPGPVPSFPVTTCPLSRHAGDNLVTMAFTEIPGQINVQLTYWFIGESPIHSQSMNFSLT